MKGNNAINQKELYSYAKKHGVLVIEGTDERARVICRKHPSSKILLELRRWLHRPIHVEEVSDEKFNTLLTQTYEAGSSTALQMAEDIEENPDLTRLILDMPKTEDLLESEDDAPVIRLLNALFTQAIKQNASDIHIESTEDELFVRYRIDGVLREVLKSQRVLGPLLVSRIKVMAKLDIAEKRLPQDGRIALRIAGHPVDIRVSTMPTNHGERTVLRLLDKEAGRLDLNQLGMSANGLTATEEIIAKPHGIFLVTGPTGSGKTTSLYAIITELNQVSRNILTVEDPIEYDLPGIGQTQVSSKVDMTFAKGLRAMLRQDPDVVMVGEIRDLETAQIAVQASLTGHLVLSTLHTNSAIGAITRLRDMGIEPFLVSSSLIGVIAQRLVRVICQDCKEERPPTTTEIATMGLDENNPTPICQGKGCEKCDQSGYRGRTGIYEVVVIDDKLREYIHEHTSEYEMEAYSRTRLPSMRQDGFDKILQGITTLDEVLRVTSEE